MEGQDGQPFPLLINAAYMGPKQTLHLRNERFIWMIQFINHSECLNIFITEELTQDLMFCLILFHYVYYMLCVSFGT